MLGQAAAAPSLVIVAAFRGAAEETVETAQWAVTSCVCSLMLDVHAVSRARRRASFLREAQLQSCSGLPSRMHPTQITPCHAYAMVTLQQTGPARYESYTDLHAALPTAEFFLCGQSCSCCDTSPASFG